MIDLSGLRNFNVAALMTDATGKALSLPVAKIDFDPDNVRTKITDESIAELAAGIKAQGLLQPISVRRHPKKNAERNIRSIFAQRTSLRTTRFVECSKRSRQME